MIATPVAASIDTAAAVPEAAPSDRFAWPLVALALVAPWWLPLLSQPITTFYKEWLFAVALGFAGLAFAPLAFGGPSLRRQPMFAACLALMAVLVLQALFVDGVWRRAVLMVASVAFFAFTMVLGQSVRQRRGADAVSWVATCLFVAALGSCVFALLQLLGIKLPFAVLPWAGGRLYGNLAQANHFADLLWIGCAAAAVLYAAGRLKLVPALAAVVVLQAFTVLSGSRMVWVFVVVLALLGLAARLRHPSADARRLGSALLALAALHVAVVAAVSASGVLEAFAITSAEQRISSGDSADSNRQRLWFWRVGLDAVHQHPLLGVGAGRFAGHALELATQVPESPPAGADTQAHNVFLQIAAELGAPVALLVAACLALWLAAAWRRARRHPEILGAFALMAPILVHANLEHPLAYLYFLGTLGLLIGLVPNEPSPAAPAPPVPAEETAPLPSNALRFASFAVLLGAIGAYVQYNPVERAMQVLQAQVRAGSAPQPSQALAARLAAIPAWSAFGDYAELIAVVTAVPTAADARAWLGRCNRVVAIGPTAHLLARCATAAQAAGDARRASWLANGLCKVYPDSAPVLIESMLLVELASPAVANLESRCVDRVK